MRKIRTAFLFAVAVLSYLPAHAMMMGNRDVQYLNNPQTARPDLITLISTRNIIAGSNITVVANSTGVTISASGGGSSSLPLLPGDTNYIQNVEASPSHQTPTTVWIDSETIEGPITIQKSGHGFFQYNPSPSNNLVIFDNYSIPSLEATFGFRWLGVDIFYLHSGIAQATDKFDLFISSYANGGNALSRYQIERLGGGKHAFKNLTGTTVVEFDPTHNSSFTIPIYSSQTITARSGVVFENLSPGIAHIVIGSSATSSGQISPSTDVAAGVLPNTVQVSSVGAQVIVASFPATGVTAGTYSNPVMTVDAQGRATSVSNGANVSYKEACMFATIAALPANSYANGSSGVGATLTGLSIGALAVDGYTVSTGQRILVKNEATPADNGIYTVTTVGGVGVYVLTRATDFDQSAEVEGGDAVYVTSGTALIGTGWIDTNFTAVTMGTTAINFTQFTGSGTYTAASPVTLVNNTFGLSGISLSSGVTGSLPAASIAAGNLGGSVVTSSIAINTPLLQSTLQTGTTLYPQFLYAGSSATVNGNFGADGIIKASATAITTAAGLIANAAVDKSSITSQGIFTAASPAMLTGNGFGNVIGVSGISLSSGVVGALPASAMPILAVGTGAAANFTNNITSPTAAISFHGNLFRTTTNGTTSFVTLDTATANGLLMVSSAGATYLTLSSAAASYFPINGILANNFNNYKATQTLDHGSNGMFNIGSTSSSFSAGGGLVVQSTLTANGGLYVSALVKTASYTMKSTDTVVLASCTAVGGCTITLPGVADTNQVCTVTKVDASTQPINVVTAAAADLIGSTNTVWLHARSASIKLISDGGRWQPLGRIPSIPTFLGYAGDPNSAQAVNASSNVNYVAITVPDPCTAYAIRLVFSGTISGTVDTGIYDSDPVTGKPNNRLASAGTLPIANGNFTSSFTAQVNLMPGNYWMAIDVSNVGVTIARFGIDTYMGALTQTSTSATLPTTAASTSATNARVWSSVLLIRHSVDGT